MPDHDDIHVTIHHDSTGALDVGCTTVHNDSGVHVHLHFRGSDDLRRAAIDRLLDAIGLDRIDTWYDQLVERATARVVVPHDPAPRGFPAIDGPAVPVECAPASVGEPAVHGDDADRFARALRDVLKRTWLRDDELDADSPVTFGHLLDALRIARDGLAD